MASLDESISLHQEALLLRPSGHPDRSNCLSNLANSLQSHFNVTRTTTSLDKAIAISRETLLELPNGHPNRPDVLNGLAWYLLTRFDSQGESHDLEESIFFAQQSLESIATISRPYPLDTLAMGLRHKPDRLEESLSYSREATVKLDVHDWECLKNLATILLCCHKNSPNRQYVEEARSVCGEALRLCPAWRRGEVEAVEAEALAILASLPPSNGGS